MSFFGTIISLGCALSAVLTAYFFGHGLSNRQSSAFITAAVFALICAVLAVTQVRLGRRDPAGH